MRRFWNYKFNSRVLNGILTCILPIASLILVEYYTHVITDLTVLIFLANLLIYYLVYAAVTFLTGKLSVGYFICTLFFMLFGLLNYVVVMFRSTPVVPWDIYSIRTAVSVAGNYKLTPDSHMLISVAGFLILLLVCQKLKSGRILATVRLAFVVVSCVGIFLYTSMIGTEPVIQAVGLDTILFTPNVLYRNNGLVTGFLGIMKYLRVEQPSQYSEKHVQAVLSDYSAEETADDDLPNIIVIMNEAFSDPAVYGDFEVTEDYMPFIHSMRENTWKGNCYVSVKGGNTANSEYEFLTGNSMKFLPSGSVPYQQYIKSETPSLASRLKELGYQTAAVHPYHAAGWNRNTVYPMLGFDKQFFKPDFDHPDTLRGYISDRSAFDKLIELYENKEEGSPLFAFEVTMQNHGGYSKEYADLSEEILLKDYPEPNTQIRSAEKYLTLLRKTDDAFKELIEYFEQQDEKTVILMFGDHQPSDYITNTFARLQGLDTTDENVVRTGYIVPYIMWSNYETGAPSMKHMSLNYLSTLLAEKCQIPLTSYQKYLKELYKDFPVITATQLRNSAEEVVEADYKDVASLNDYACLSFNLLCDRKHKQWDSFQ